jgi:hypothetical protein
MATEIGLLAGAHLPDEAPQAAYHPPHSAVRDNLEAFGRAARGLAPYPVGHGEMLANVRTFEAVQRSALSGSIETI